ncbi:MAG: methylglutamate dehydrogenase [Rugosibacter sp.]
MNRPQPLSPIHDALNALHPVWDNNGLDQKPVLSFDSPDEHKASILGIADLSHQPRTGAKGHEAASWLYYLGVQTPPSANRWFKLPDGGLIARLGATEFLIEDNPLLVEKIMHAKRINGVYPVLRQDASFALCGHRVNELFLQTCNVDFRVLGHCPSKVVLTSMAGVGVAILARKTGVIPTFQLWCDGTYGIYLWETLANIANELGGGGIGLDALP